MDEDAIKKSEKESGRLLANIFDSLRKNIKLRSEKSKNEEVIEHNIALIVEAIQGNYLSCILLKIRPFFRTEN
jgi:hypothetical protein